MEMRNWIRGSLLTGSLVALGAAPSLAASPYAMADGNWVSLGGEVAAVESDAFMLDYGEGLITVEIDDWDWYDETTQLRPGETVNVYGAIDDDFFEKTTIEAQRIYAKERNTFYYSSASDEEAVEEMTTPLFLDRSLMTADEGTWITLTGTVDAIDGRSVKIDTGSQVVTLDTSELTYNPLDKTGIQVIDKGDVVQASGPVHDSLFGSKKLVVEELMSLFDDQQNQAS